MGSLYFWVIFGCFRHIRKTIARLDCILVVHLKSLILRRQPSFEDVRVCTLWLTVLHGFMT